MITCRPQCEGNGLTEGQCEITVEALNSIIANYTREAGVRQFEREIGRVMRHAAMRVADGAQLRVRVDVADLDGILGPAKYEHEIGLRASLPGVATGLAWTPAGGDILFIEATRVSGRGQLILTGQLGGVMKESAQAAFIALASLFTDRPINHDVAMTGEISLRGMVLPVGGIKEKVLAAQRAGLRAVLLPARNEKDLRDVPEATRATLEFVFLETVDDAIQAALGQRGASRAASEFKLI